jgi:hypothetical protein
MRRLQRLCAVGVGAGLVAGIVMCTASPAGAELMPRKTCFGKGHWVTENKDRNSTQYNPSDVVEVPQKDTVEWAGNEDQRKLGYSGARRPISGEVQLDILGLSTVDIDTWGGSSIRYANQGTHKYDMPSFLVGVKMKLKGEHREAGVKKCGGSVYVKIKGDTNPLKIGSIAGLVLSSLGLIAAGFNKVKPAFEDINRG